MKNSLIFLILFIHTLTLTLFSQSVSPEVIATAGQHDANASNQVSWTLGETVITTESNSSNILTQGFHQSDLIINAIEEEDPFGIKVYPNPVADQFTIEVTGSNQPLDFRLIDMKGEILLGGRLDPTLGNRQVSVEQLSLGNYILQVSNPAATQKQSFKIQKIR